MQRKGRCDLIDSLTVKVLVSKLQTLGQHFTYPRYLDRKNEIDFFIDLSRIAVTIKAVESCQLKVCAKYKSTRFRLRVTRARLFVVQVIKIGALAVAYSVKGKLSEVSLPYIGSLFEEFFTIDIYNLGSSMSPVWRWPVKSIDIENIL